LQIEAFRALKNEKLIIIGCYEKSNVFNDYVEYIKKIKPKNVEIRSFISEKEKNDLYTHCKGLIATSIDEDFGMNAVEAMSAGKPVIAVNEGGYKETVIEGKTGHLVEAKVESIIKAIEKIKSPLKYQKASEKQAKKFSRERFISEIKKIISLFEKKEDKQIKIGTYDNIAKIYDKRLNSKTISEENLFLKEINTKGKTILDLGCGTGRLSSKLAKKAKKIIAIDNSKNMIRLAKAKKIPNAKFIHSNMEKLPFKKSSFDIIISSLSIEHIKDFEKVLKEIKRVLKTNGKFIFSISNKINNSTYIHFETQKEIVKIKNYLKPKKYYLKKLIENGFQIKKISSVKIHPKLKKLNQNIYDFWKGKTMSYIINTKKI